MVHNNLGMKNALNKFPQYNHNVIYSENPKLPIEEEKVTKEPKSKKKT